MGGVEAGVAAGTGTALVLYRALAGLSAMVDLSVVVSFRRLCAAYLLIRRRDGGRQRVYRLRRGDRRLAMAGAPDASTHARRYTPSYGRLGRRDVVQGKSVSVRVDTGGR